MSEPSTPTGIPSPLWTENQRLKTANAELVAQLAAERERAERAEGEAAGLRQGYAELQAAVAQANTELAAACAVIAGIQAHGGWAEARIREALSDE